MTDDHRPTILDTTNEEHRRTREALLRTLTALEPPKSNPDGMTNSELAEAIELELLVGDWIATYESLDDCQRRGAVRRLLQRPRR